MLAGALGLAGPARAVFVAAARGRAPAAEVLAAVRGEASAVPEVQPAESLVWSGSPYLGLVPFGERDARVFYGRGELVAQLVQRLAGRLDGAGMLVVAGESGAGKSSLLRAGWKASPFPDCGNCVFLSRYLRFQELVADLLRRPVPVRRV